MNTLSEEAREEPPRPFGEQLPELVTIPPGPESREMARRLSRVESRNVTHISSEFPVFWEEAAGANVRDVDGNLYLDLTGAFGVSVAGHTNSRVVGTIREQSRRLIHGMGDVHPPAPKVALLEAISEVAPWPESLTILGSAGTEAVEAALKTALLATGKAGIVAFEGAYHGLTLGSLAVTEREDFRGPFRARLYPGVGFIPFPDPLREGDRGVSRSLDALDEALRNGVEGHEVGAVLLEPIQGRGGVRIPPEGFLREVSRLASEAGALLIFDEIFTGLGRTGSMFAFNHEEVLPDLLCLGKGLGGGLPLSACVGPREVMNAWPPSDGEAIHTSTFLGHPLACAAGVATLEELASQDLVGRSRTQGVRCLKMLREALADVPEVLEVRGRGLFLGIEFADPNTLAPMEGMGVRVSQGALKKGILVLPAGLEGHVLELSPPLVVTSEQLDWAVPMLVATVREVLARDRR